MTRTRLIPAEGFPVSVAEVQTHLRIDGSVEDIEQKIAAATDAIEQLVGPILESTWRAYWLVSEIPEDGIVRLPAYVTQSLIAVKSIDSSGGETAWQNDNQFSARLWANPAELALRSVPTSHLQVDFVCGWSTPSQVPPALMHALLLSVGDQWENREGYINSTYPQRALARGIESLTALYRQAFALALQ